MTQRDREIIGLLLRGWQDKEIANELGIATRTVKAHMSKMFVRYRITDGIKRIKLAVMFYELEREKLGI